MDINKFAVFLAVADAGSFGKASEKTGYTQAGISYIIKTMENEFGVKLFSRTSTGVRLTDSGRNLLPEIRRVVSSYGSFESTLLAQKMANVISLHIGTVDTMATKWLPRTIELFNIRYPDVLLDVTSGDPFEIKEMLLTEEIDLGLTERAWEDERFRWVPLAKDPYVVVFPPGTNAPYPCPYTFLNGKQMYISDYGRERRIPELIQKHQFAPFPLNDKLSNNALINIIGNGKGSTIMSSMSYEVCQIGQGIPSPEVVPLESGLSRELNIVLREENITRPMHRGFINCMKEAVKEYPIAVY